MPPSPSNQERIQVGRKRLISVLQTYTIACMRTLEQKISDAGPTPQRIDPHVLTVARKELQKEGRIININAHAIDWYHLSDTNPTATKNRLKILGPIHAEINRQQVKMRIGQALEIAIYRCLRDGPFKNFFGSFSNIDEAPDAELYKKQEPPSQIGKDAIAGNRNIDFLGLQNELRFAIEAKNIREWLYPDRKEIKDLLKKALEIRAVPVLIGRRIPYVTFRVLSPCGLLIHQNYNQLFPASEQSLADKAKDKKLLGYHDIRLGNQPDKRLTKFIHENLPGLLGPARERFEAFSDLITKFAYGEMGWAEFAARVRRRETGANEDNDWPGGVYEPPP